MVMMVIAMMIVVAVMVVVVIMRMAMVVTVLFAHRSRRIEIAPTSLLVRRTGWSIVYR
ncbi:hypothetical protein [Bradyrhizobium liaoningense]